MPDKKQNGNLPERNKWEINQLKKDIEKQNEGLSDHELRIRSLEDYRIETTQLLKAIVDRIKSLEANSVWVSRSFFGILFTGIAGALAAFLKWLADMLTNGGVP